MKTISSAQAQFGQLLAPITMVIHTQNYLDTTLQLSGLEGQF